MKITNRKNVKGSKSMPTLQEQIKEVRSTFTKALTSIQSAKDVQTIRIQFLGKKGHITALLTELKNLSTDDKKLFGPQLNKLKQEVLLKLQEKEEELIKQEVAASERKKQFFDVTSYIPDTIKGRFHPYTPFVEEIENILLTMGYEPLDGPEVESDYYNFTALNIPEDHPARDMYDTFWLTHPGMLLRTHTSTVQIPTMKTHALPIAAISIGRCYRHEATDASHDFMFMQCEGFLVNENVTLSHLFATAKHFLQTLFKKEDLAIRIRPGFFPFVEPGVEIDMQCPFCTKGCSVCKKTRWIEVFPGGLIHPNVLKFGGIDPEKYSGFAFGFGLTRLAMIKYGINDIRLFHSGKMKFLEQF